MNELISTNHNDNGDIIISGRELHGFLEVVTEYKKWFMRMVEYGFEENIDFIKVTQKCLTSSTGQYVTDHHIKLDMAKEIAMIQRTEKGKQARQYFLHLEKMWNSPEMVMKRALEFANKKVTELKERIFQDQPKVEAHDRLINADNNQKVGQVAKVLGYGRNTFFKVLREAKILMSDNTPYQQYIERGYFVVRETPITMGGQEINKPQTYVTAKGLAYLDKKFNRKPTAPTVDQEKLT